MARVALSKHFTMPVEEVREGIEKLGKSLYQDHGLDYAWTSNDRVEFKHKAVKGFIAIEGNQLVLELKLSMMYAAMAPIVKSRIHEMADKLIS